jgi:hypothetical protein
VGVPEVVEVGLTVEDDGGVVVIPELVTTIVELVTTMMDVELGLMVELVTIAVETGADVELLVTPFGAQLMMVLVSRVTAALSATNEPVLVTPVVTVMAVLARITPLKVVPVPKVAELPIRKMTLHA